MAATRNLHLTFGSTVPEVKHMYDFAYYIVLTQEMATNYFPFRSIEQAI
jgi:hypothetical protein